MNIIIWILGIVFGGGALAATIKIYFNDLKDLKKIDAKQESRITTLEADMKWVKETLKEIKDNIK